MRASSPSATVLGSSKVRESGEIAKEKDALSRQLEKLKPRPFRYSHQGSLAYIGSGKAIADLPFFNGNVSACLYHRFLMQSILTGFNL
ncbi:hypothetical protein FIBSPDRAFT_879705 [Athelia psychrophila]|uniref:External alternative NADH-ubiquinone oxidoreductase-like C-terminal domain-containing protein n=1 Tax=Athelia psychrophila TaxID=1759441 RepID=A0A167TPD8_9AGAM|nr:hypothetical protein FIBSPDRAFT_879705 [Fibularhizoctonia sp. CBS 109695]